jgi:methylmalonyl-CoA/ethylmalonyl-CoA epimerase
VGHPDASPGESEAKSNVLGPNAVLLIMKISHLGIAVKDLESAERLFRSLLNGGGEQAIHHEVVDNQKVRIASFQLGEAMLELTAATSPESPIAGFIEKRGEGIHHIAIEVDDIEKELIRLKREGFRLIDEHARDGAHGMQIAFLHPKSTNGVLIELCQSASAVKDQEKNSQASE